MAKQQRIALVIGNGAYTTAPKLSNPVNDAALITLRLKELEFDILGGATTAEHPSGLSAGSNLDFPKMSALVGEFMQKVLPGALAVIYYAGHGLQVGDQNYLVPVDDDLSEAKPDLGLIKIKERVETVVSRVGKEGNVVVFLDACRNNPISDDQKRSLMGLAVRNTASDDMPARPQDEAQPVFNPRDPATLGRNARSLNVTARSTLATFKMKRDDNVGRTFIGFATAPGEEAMDGARSNSAFALAMDRHLKVRGLDIVELYDRVAKDVSDDVAYELHDVQDPWSETNLKRQLYLHPRSAWPIIALGLLGLLAGFVTCFLIFEPNSETSRLVDLTDRPWDWFLGLLFGLVMAFGTMRWGSRSWRDALFAFVGPGFGFALAMAILKLLPTLPPASDKYEPGISSGLAQYVFITVTLVGGALYFAATLLVWYENPPEWPRYALQWINRLLTLMVPAIVIFALYRLQFYISHTNPVYTVTALFTVLGGVVYCVSVVLSCRSQRGLFNQFGPMTGAITVGLMMAAFYAVFADIAGGRSLSPQQSWPYLVAAGVLWHGLLGAQLGYCFTFYIPDHEPRTKR